MGDSICIPHTCDMKIENVKSSVDVMKRHWLVF
jgi:hypothetical protein